MRSAIHAGIPARFPSAVLGRVMANASGDPKTILNAIKTDFERFKADHFDQMGDLQKVLDGVNARLGALGIAGIVSSIDQVEDQSYSTPYASYFRHGQEESFLKSANAEGGRAQILASMNEGTGSAGGFLAPVEWDRRVLQALRNISPLRRLCDVQVTKTRGYSTTWSDGAFGSGWVGEVASRPATSTPTLSSIQFIAGEIYANPAISQNLLDDADFRIEDWLASELGTVFALQEGVAFISGDGVNKPTGFLTHITGAANAGAHPGGAIPVVVTGAANSVTGDGLLDLIYDLPGPYRQGSAFLMSSITANMISKLKDGQGNYLWRQSAEVGQPSTLLGYEVAIDENMPAPVAGNTPVAFGNWKQGYVINDRAGLKTLRDPYTAKPFVQFYCTKRVGGGVKDPNALRVQRVSNS